MMGGGGGSVREEVDLYLVIHLEYEYWIRLDIYFANSLAETKF